MPKGHKGTCLSTAAYTRSQGQSAVARKQRISDRQAWVDAYKVKHGCVDCGYARHPRALDFDHTDPALKTANISKLLRFASWEVILTEIAKCLVRCACCHRIKTLETNVDPGKEK